MILLKLQKVIENQIVSTNILFKNFTEQCLEKLELPNIMDIIFFLFILLENKSELNIF